MVTYEQELAFYRHKAGYDIPTVKKPQNKPKNGKLAVVDNKGNILWNVKYDLPFPLLQSIKKDLIRNGYKAKNLVIKYL